jgi:hypothetical protein
MEPVFACRSKLKIRLRSAKIKLPFKVADEPQGSSVQRGDYMSDDGAFLTVRDRLLADRKTLLDLGTRNRLIHIPLRTKNIRAIEIVDEKSSEIFRLLSEGKGFTFLPGRSLSAEEKADLGEGSDETGGIPQPNESETSVRHLVRRSHS